MRSTFTKTLQSRPPFLALRLISWALVTCLVLCPLTANAAEPDAPATNVITQHIEALRAEPNLLARVSGSRRGYDSPGVDAVFALRKIGAVAVEPVSVLLRDETQRVRLNAIYALRWIEGLEAKKALLRALDDRAWEVRAATVEGLSALAERSILDAVLARLKDEHEGVRLTAVRRLALQDKTFKNHPDNVAINRILAALQESANSPDAMVRAAVTQTLGSYRTGNALPQLIKLSRDSDVEVRAVAAAALGRTRSRRAFEPLTAMLADKRNAEPDAVDVLRNVIASLGEIRDPRAVNAVLGLLDHRDSQTRATAVRTLGLIGDRRAVERLTPLLRATDDRVPIVVAVTLGELNDVRAVEPLIAAVESNDEQVRVAVMTALGRLNDARAIEPLVEELFRADEKTVSPADAAEAALERIHDARVIRALAARAVAAPTADGGFRARRLVGKLVDRDFRFDAEGFAAWWRVEQARSEARR